LANSITINTNLVAKYKKLEVYINARFLTQQITGVQQFAFEICRNLSASAVNYILLAPQGVSQPAALTHLGFKNIGRGDGYIWEQVELPRFLKKQGEPLLLNFCNTAPMLYRNQWVTIHDLAFMHHPEWFSKNFARVYRFLIPRIAKRSAKVLTVSQTIVKQLQTVLGVEQIKIELIPNGIHHELLAHSQSETGNRKPFILTVSSINPRKNLAYLIKVFEQSRLTNHQLIVVGARNAVFGREQMLVPKNVTFVGYLPNAELIQLYHEAELFVSLSLDEGFGIPVLEALYCNCRVLISDIEVYRECFGQVATFTSVSNIEQAAHDLRKTIENKEVVKPDTGLFERYNYAHSAKKLNELVIESLK
jgi:glycosyltransferase involved in cell wall biosynthesis